MAAEQGGALFAKAVYAYAIPYIMQLRLRANKFDAEIVNYKKILIKI